MVAMMMVIIVAAWVGDSRCVHDTINVCHRDHQRHGVDGAATNVRTARSVTGQLDRGGAFAVA